MVKKYKGGGGRFPKSKAKSRPSQSSRKRKSKGTSNNHSTGYHGIDVPELMDTEANVYIPSTTMQKLSKRPGRLIDEVKYTANHQGETLGRALRNKPIEFVKAKEVYDPSRDLLKKVEQIKEKVVKDIENENANDIDVEVEDVEVLEAESPEAEPVVVEDEEDESEGFSEVQQEDLVKNLSITDNAVTSLRLKSGFCIDEKGDKKLSERVIKPDTTTLIKEVTVDQTEYDPTLTVGKVSMTTFRDDSGNSTIELPLTSKHEIESEDKAALYRDYIANVIRGIQAGSDDDDEDEDEDEDENENDSSEFEYYEEDPNDKEPTDEEIEEEIEEESKDPEYGFLPEDYEFDVSKISVSNLRYGIKNQYFTRCLELTGSEDEGVWIDEDEIIDYALANGVKEHRIPSFLKFITASFMDSQNEAKEEDYDDVYISDSSEDEELIVEHDSEEEDDDDLESLVSYAKASKSQDFLSLDSYDPQYKPKRRGPNLDQFDLDNELRESLMDQYEIHRQGRKNRKQNKRDAALQDGIDKHDLLAIYEFSIHIRDMKREFELFLHDSDRQDMSFPPLDPHGNKTITKMAKGYNLKSKKCGNRGLNQFIKVSKYRGTFHYLPRYNEINHMLNQRPIFHRTDKKRPKEEFEASDQAKTRRGKPQHAVLKEGDIVGAQAPEIDRSNIGRQLLERMGWIQGEGLGAMGNKGISEPVMAKIKKSKVGIVVSK
ncbi:uncharacterized protein RJT21DRAFT_44729 [Scheffersomyces amazonensis]|uniref:uncharacterized protein n=1 Tax=Scheffersomyces amazonensis TaxID=1078765 RepID=UPI00315DE4B0